MKNALIEKPFVLIKKTMRDMDGIFINIIYFTIILSLALTVSAEVNDTNLTKPLGVVSNTTTPFVDCATPSNLLSTQTIDTAICKATSLASNKIGDYWLTAIALIAASIAVIALSPNKGLAAVIIIAVWLLLAKMAF